jgi:hypothetical protein
MRVWLKAASVLAAMIGTMANAAPLDAEHAMLARLSGHWSVKQSLWATPGAPPAVDPGDADFSMVLDGSRLRQTLRIAAKDKPFEGFGYIGYDTVDKTFFSAWMDVGFTGLIVAKGDYDAAAKRYTFKGQVPDSTRPGTTFPLREVMSIRDDDHFTYDYYETHGGKEALVVALEYTRVR